MSKLKRIDHLFNSPEVSSYEKSFKQLLDCTTHLAEYLSKNEGIQTVGLCKTQETMVRECFFNLSLELKNKKLLIFKNYYNTCHHYVQSGYGLKEKRSLLAKFMWRNRLKIPAAMSIFELIEEDTYVEIYNQHFQQVYRSPNFLHITNHSLMALECCDVFTLFSKCQEILSEQMEFVAKIYQQEITVPVYNPSREHTVKEINSKMPRSSQVTPLAYVPVYDEANSFQGFMHVFKLINSRNLNFKLTESC